MRTVFRPFWSYDLPGTEAWLADMAGKGWLIEEWNLLLRRFTFRKGEPIRLTYQIAYGPYSRSPIASSLAAEGWGKRLQQGKWCLFENTQPSGQIKVYPSRKDILRRNRIISYVFTGILVYLLLIALIPLLALGLTYSNDTPIRIQPSPMWAATWTAAALAVLLLVLAIYSLIKLRAANRELLQGYTDLKQPSKPHKPAGTTMARMKLGWMYAPDRLEQWLEDKELDGWNLYKVGFGGTLFHFSKGRPRRMKYHADYQVVAGEGYFELHQEAGWTRLYSSPFSLQKWTLWSRENPEHAEYPELYTDPLHRLKHARKIAISYTLLFLPMILLYSLNVSAFIDSILRDEFTASQAWNTSIMFLSILLFGSFAGRTWLYYRRLKLQ
ncbi:hypothetical protein C173_12110 [Paenibacillus sp. FSL R7-277]|uniref:DUF2812 domain-containing protein n=1 Tax=Paenibacillus sp. FSL R7-277 TaxID=1227352 RepID=UPI0003E27B1F|nr:DUF2812 domain-containing protein [Paenibacillus sp. FSL R7-277]ETT73320.1 hypothetical protein C173_12110 [Paenibacillus sp. FSL R7-277]